MKIVILAEVLGEKNNGTTLACYNLINHLVNKGHDVKVICPDVDKKGLPGYYILEVTDMGPIINGIFKRNGVVLAKYDEKLIRDVVKDADVVHCLVPLWIARKASKLIKSMNIPLTASFHAQAENLTAHLGLMRSKTLNHLVYKWYDNNLFVRADAIHYPTKFIKDVFEKEMKRKTPAYVISNGVNDVFKPAPGNKPEEYKDKFVILFIGRLSKEKRHIVLMKAVEMSKYSDKIQLVFAGSGPLEEEVKKYSKKHLKNQPHIEFMSRDKLIETINYCDLYCHPSYAEIEAISCLEAITCGLVPIIANSSQSATREFAIDDRSLFKTDDSRDLANKIDHFIEHPEELKELREKYLSMSVKYDQTSCMNQMEQMLFDVVNKHKEEANE